jgi:hypothetical protein
MTDSSRAIGAADRPGVLAHPLRDPVACIAHPKARHCQTETAALRAHPKARHCRTETAVTRNAQEAPSSSPGQRDR